MSKNNSVNRQAAKITEPTAPVNALADAGLGELIQLLKEISNNTGRLAKVAEDVMERIERANLLGR